MKPIIVIGLTPQGLSVLRVLSMAGHNVIAFYQNKKNIGVKSKFGTKIQFADSGDLRRLIRETASKYNGKLLCYITSGELLAMILREYKELYDICDVISGPFETIEKLAHKDIMYQIAISKGFKVAKHYTLDKFSEGDLEFPIFMKRNYEIPLFFKATIIEDKKEFDSYMSRIKEKEKKDILVQEFINIPSKNLMEITAQAFFSCGKMLGVFIANQERRLKKGLTSYIEEITDTEILSHISTLVQEFMLDLKYTGFAEFEFMYNTENKELYFVEVNTRTCGLQSSLYHKWSNLDDVLSNPYNAPILVPRSNKPLRWMNISRDIRVRIQRKNFRNIFDIFRSKYDIFTLSDIKPFISQFLW